MNFLTQLLDFLARILRWWVIIEPWEQAVRVRFGKHTTLLQPGLHFRIPFVDAVYPQNVRLRIQMMYSQTITSLDGLLFTLCGSLRYRVVDVMLLQQSLHNAAETIGGIAANLVAECVATHNSKELSPEFVARWVSAKLDFTQYGLGDVTFKLQDFAAPRRVIRLIQDSLGQGTYVSDRLSTTQAARQDVPAT